MYTPPLALSFRRLVVLMRRMTHLELTMLSEAAFSCRDFPSCNAPFEHDHSADILQVCCLGLSTCIKSPRSQLSLSEAGQRTAKSTQTEHTVVSFRRANIGVEEDYRPEPSGFNSALTVLKN